MSWVLMFIDGPMAGEYLISYDPDYHDGIGKVTATPDVEDAYRFESMTEAMEQWKKPSTVHPVRLTDGKPNRPMTAWSVSPIKLPAKSEE